MALFHVVTRPPKEAVKQAFLIDDNWDDWGKYRTQFNLVVFDESGTKFQPGEVKIGHVGLRPSPRIAPGYRAPGLPQRFEVLPQQYFSLGQNESYYETLNQLTPGLRDTILTGLRDCALNLERFNSLQSEDVMGESLLRHVRPDNVRTKYHRLARGDARLTRFDFGYEFGPDETDRPPIDFHIKPDSNPPTNVHVLIGRNGVGKTRCLQGMAFALLDSNGDNTPGGKLFPIRQKKDAFDTFFGEEDWSFSGLIFVSFSAFDALHIPSGQPDGLRVTQIGLQKNGTPTAEKDMETTTKSRKELRDDFVESLSRCRRDVRRRRWTNAMETLHNDPLFAEANFTGLLDLPESQWKQAARRLFTGLSSGHAIVLLTITQLVELVDERTLVLIDEPESHLHPPLLSAFIRSLADLLVQRNGVAIVATHSPVVLQEVPRSCVWMLRRSGLAAVSERPAVETFGENVGILTREIFGLEVTNSGFHRLLRKAISEDRLDFEEVLERFSEQLGAEAKAIVRALIAERDES